MTPRPAVLTPSPTWAATEVKTGTDSRVGPWVPTLVLHLPAIRLWAHHSSAMEAARGGPRKCASHPHRLVPPLLTLSTRRPWRRTGPHQPRRPRAHRTRPSPTLVLRAVCRPAGSGEGAGRRHHCPRRPASPAPPGRRPGVLSRPAAGRHPRFSSPQRFGPGGSTRGRRPPAPPAPPSRVSPSAAPLATRRQAGRFGSRSDAMGPDTACAACACAERGRGKVKGRGGLGTGLSRAGRMRHPASRPASPSQPWSGSESRSRSARATPPTLSASWPRRARREV